MKPASIKILRDELKELDKDEIIDHCLALARSRQEAKELLTYRLIHSEDERTYCIDIRYEMEAMLKEANQLSVYFFKKSARKVHRYMTRSIRYSKVVDTEVFLRTAFLELLSEYKRFVNASSVLKSLYEREIEKLRKLQAKVHPDQAYDLSKDLERLQRLV